MQKKLDTAFTECDASTFKLVDSVIEKYHGADLVEKLEELFASGVPANGYRLTTGGPALKHLASKTPYGLAFTYLSYASFHSNEDALEYLIRLNYQAFEKAGCTFTNFLWSQKAATALLDSGHSFKRELKDSQKDFWSNVENLGPEFFRRLAARGTKLDMPIDNKGESVAPVIRAARLTSGPDLVVSLLAAGVDPSTRHTDESSILHNAVTHGKESRSNAFNSPAQADRLEAIIQAVIAADGNIDMVDDAGRSALHLAAWLGYADKVRVLLEAGADQHLKDRERNTPEDLARTARRRDVLPLFSAVRARNAIMNVIAKAAGADAKQ